MRLMVGLERPAAGRVELFGSPPERSHRRSRVGYLPQRATLGLDAPITVRELVTAGRTPLRGLLRPHEIGRASCRERVRLRAACLRGARSSTADTAGVR